MKRQAVFVAVDSNLGAVVGAQEGATDSISGNEGRIAQAWVNVRGGVRVFSVHFWHSDGWTTRNEALLEAVVKQAQTTRHPWLVPGDAQYACGRRREEPVVSKESDACSGSGRSVHMQVKSAQGEWIERTKDYVIACLSLRGQISQINDVEDFESRPHKAVSFVVEREREGNTGMA